MQCEAERGQDALGSRHVGVKLANALVGEDATHAKCQLDVRNPGRPDSRRRLNKRPAASPRNLASGAHGIPANVGVAIIIAVEDWALP
jgi:hypothetical protein